MARILVTGATGFVGGHVAEACAARGDTVTTIARENSDTALLENWGVRIVRGDMTDPATIATALADVEMVVHCAAKLGDWGPIEEYRQVNVAGLRHLLEACQSRNLRRFVYLSSLGVYAARHHYQTDESEPLPEKHMDGYTQSKVEAEKLALEYHQQKQIPIVILRPGFIYGPRDRTVLPNVVANLKRKVVRYVAGGKYALNTTYVGNLVDAILLALERPGCVGQIYNITDGEFITKRKFFELVADNMGLRRPGMGGPLWAAKLLTKIVENRARKKGWKEAPRLTMAKLKFLGLNLDFSIAKARKELGYNPRVAFEDGMLKAIAWFKQAEEHRKETVGGSG